MAPLPRAPTLAEIQQAGHAVADVVRIVVPIVGVTAPILASGVRALQEAFDSVFGEDTKTMAEMLGEVAQNQAAILAHQAAIDALVKRLLVAAASPDVTPHGTPVPVVP